MFCIASFASTKSRYDGMTWRFLLVCIHYAALQAVFARLKTESPYQGAHSTHAKEHTTTSQTPTLAQATAVLPCRIQACIPGPILLGSVHCRKLLHSVAYYNLAHRLTRTAPNTRPLVALHTPRRSMLANPRTRRKEGDRPKLKHSKGRKRRQHAVRFIHPLGEGDNRSPHLLNRLLQDPAQNKVHERKHHRKRRHRHCLRIP